MQVTRYIDFIDQIEPIIFDVAIYHVQREGFGKTSLSVFPQYQQVKQPCKHPDYISIEQLRQIKPYTIRLNKSDKSDKSDTFAIYYRSSKIANLFDKSNESNESNETNESNESNNLSTPSLSLLYTLSDNCDVFIIPPDESDKYNEYNEYKERELYRSYRDTYDDTDEAYDVSDLYNVQRNYPTFEEYKATQVKATQWEDFAGHHIPESSQIKQLHNLQTIRTISEPEMFKEMTKWMTILIGRVHSISLRGLVHPSSHLNTGLDWLANSVCDIMRQSGEFNDFRESVTDHFVDIMYYAIQEDTSCNITESDLATSQSTQSTQSTQLTHNPLPALPKQLRQYINHSQYLRICYTLYTHREPLYETMLGDLYKNTGTARITTYILYGWLARDSYMRSLPNTAVFDPTMLNRIIW